LETESSKHTLNQEQAEEESLNDHQKPIHNTTLPMYNLWMQFLHSGEIPILGEVPYRVNAVLEVLEPTIRMIVWVDTLKCLKPTWVEMAVHPNPVITKKENMPK
jgi:TFIIF-interacting CTD phosphatase-like protein